MAGGERAREEGKVGRWVCGHAPKRETWEEGGNSGEINGTWLTSRWCTPGEKFAYYSYMAGKKMRGKKIGLVVLFQCSASRDIAFIRVCYAKH